MARELKVSGPDLNGHGYRLPGVYARVKAFEQHQDGLQDPRCGLLEPDEKAKWPVYRSRLLPQLHRGEPVLVPRHHPAVTKEIADYAVPVPRYGIDIAGWDGARIPLSEVQWRDGRRVLGPPRLLVDRSVTGWLVSADDTVIPDRGGFPWHLYEYWERDGEEVDGQGCHV
jgi:hypothetical protein